MPTAPIEHYENFPVASWLCPAEWRPAVSALYHFARTADDLADEGLAPSSERLHQLADFRRDLLRAQNGQPLQSPWQHTIAAVAGYAHRLHLDWEQLFFLLEAFEQDVRFTASGRTYADMEELLQYCRRSANPIGRLMLQIMGQDSAEKREASDHICTALQLINFWQDLGVDLARNRHYIPDAIWLSRGLPTHTDIRKITLDLAQSVVAELVTHARQTMERGAWLPKAIPGRMGWELRAVVLGGLRVIEHIESQGFCSWTNRPVVTRLDSAAIAMRCLFYPYARKVAV